MVYRVQKMRVSILLIVLMFTVCGCQWKRDAVVEFPVERNLDGFQLHDLDSLSSAYTVSFVAGHYIFTQRDSFFFSVYDKNFRKVFETARKGHGSNEWMAPCITGQAVDKGGISYFYVLERPSHKLFMFPVVDNGQPIMVEDFGKIDEKDLRYAFQLTSTSFIGSLDNKECDFFVYDKRTDRVNIIKQKELDFSSLKGDAHLVSQTISSYNPIAKKVAIAYFSYPLLVIRNLEGKVEKEVRFGDWPQYSQDNIGDAPDYALEIESDEENIYILYDDNKRKDKMCVLVFDWEGNPKERLYINRSIAFAVNTQDNVIIAINEDAENGVCTKYNIGVK